MTTKAQELKSFLLIYCLLIAMVTAHPSNRKLDFSQGLGIALKDGRGSPPQAYVYQMPVHHFARHVLCQNKTGKIVFYDAMSEKLSNFSDVFIESFIYDLCRLHTKENNSMLDRWVTELFDTDSNGYITHAEMNYYY